jgi:hypothetical protein
MNSTSAHVFENGIGIGCRVPGVFQPSKLGPLPFLLTVEPVDLAPVHPALGTARDARGCAARRSWSDRAESILLKLVGALFVLTLLAAGFGVQQITHVRATNRLGRELRQKEHELRTALQAYRSLESRKAVELAQASAGSTTRFASVNNPARDDAPRVVRVTAPTGSKPAQSSSVAARRSQPRNEVVTRNRTRTTGARG